MDKIETALGLMHSMICGGESHSAESIAAADAAREELNLLRAEVERLQQTIREGYPLAKQVVATRCIEIVNEKATYNDQCDRTIEAIRKEYGIE